MSFRIGHGVDMHRLVPGRKLILGGVDIPWDRGLLGHSDADVVCHALSNALLGAIGEGDIGRHFPDSDPRYKGAASLALLQEVMERVKARGFRIGNADLTILAEKPKLAPYREEIQRRLAAVLEVEPAAINIKATTGEKMGFIGREEGMMAEAVVLLESVMTVLR
ncbi:MAG TPA: 2-C-methyl-D-erythritol 2,4-cyclodiphosphate synthase [Candidatus Binatia bacterium]|nr:2-C-methyl-D-erythritol 2,4-cyclodiphosphate synthase [Candidatus Binatia bacterium]